MRLSLSRCALLAAVAAGVLLTPVRAATERPRIIYRELCKLIAVWDPSMRQTVVPEPQPAGGAHWHGLLAGLSTATINVTFNGTWDPNAQAAFQAAVDIWKTQISSPVAINVQANWSDLGSGGTLGQAGSPFVYSPTSGGVANTFYQGALASKLQGSDVDPSEPDIVATFNSAFSSWYFGTDGLTPASKYDFESVVLHELGHGLGFSGSGSENGGSSFPSCTGGVACWGLGTGVPMIYDRFVESADKRAIINTSIFPNPSLALHSIFTSDGSWPQDSSNNYLPLDPNTGIYWNGPNGIVAAGGGSNRPRLDAKSPWLEGSNYSHLNEVTYARGTTNSLMTRFLANGEVVHNPGPVTLGILQDEGWSLSCNYVLSASSATVLPTASTGNTVTVTAPAGCLWSASTSGSFVTITGGNSGNGSGTVTFSVAAAPSAAVRSTILTIAGQPFTVTQGPILSIDHTSLRFGAVGSGGTLTTKTADQTVTTTIAGAPGISWTATVTSSSPWLVVTGGSGSGSAAFTVGVKSDASLAGVTTATGTITVSAPATANAAKTITVTLGIAPTSTGPVGSFDTPAAGTSNSGSVAVTGWALDDIEVVNVEIQRDAHPNDPAGAVFNGRVFIANASFVEGARPDVEAAAPTSPLNYRAGWGYLMLTRGLVWDGQGSFNLYAIATDKEGNKVQIGSKLISVNNAVSVKPFGSIDTPGQGGTASGAYANFGWALTPGTCKIQSTGVQVSIDSGTLQPVTYGDARPDIAAGFAGFSNGANGGGHYTIDTTALANGTHTIGWLVTDDCGHVDGVGSRFFKVQNSSLIATWGALLNQPSSALPGIDSGTAVKVATGFDRKAPLKSVRPDAFGRRHVRIGELDRVEVRMPSANGTSRARYAAYLVANGQLRKLPIGSSFDPRRGTFYWQPAAGYVGDYEVVVVDQARRDSRRLTRMVISVGQPFLAPALRVRAAN